MLDFVETVAERTGKPVGIKSAVGDLRFWHDLAEKMADGLRGVDFITIDGGEGGTGAAPLVFSDTVAFPFRIGFTEVYKIFAAKGLADRVVWIGSGKLGLPDNALVAFALGCDMVHVAREAMLAIGCIQAQKCHTDHCPAGVATQNPWLAHGLDPVGKSERLARYVQTLRRDLHKVSEAAGVVHPALLGPDDVELLDGTHAHQSLRDVYGYSDDWGVPGEQIRDEITRIMTEQGKSASTHKVVQTERLAQEDDPQTSSMS